MERTHLKVGMLVEIKNNEGEATRDSQGWEATMDQYLGTTQKIREIQDDGYTIMFEGTGEYYWDIADIQLIQSVEEVKLSGKKQHFDVNDLNS